MPRGRAFGMHARKRGFKSCLSGNEGIYTGETLLHFMRARARKECWIHCCARALTRWLLKSFSETGIYDLEKIAEI